MQGFARFRFRLASLLWLVFCLAVGLWAYRYGHSVGVRDAHEMRAETGKLKTIVYPVGDLIAKQQPAAGAATTADFERLIREIQRTVLPNTWYEVGGQAGMSAYETNLSIVVSHDTAGHYRVAAFLAERRALRARTQQAYSTGKTAR